MKLFSKSLLFILIVSVSCSRFNSNNHYIKISTEYGDIIVKLYNETPLHRDNYIHLIDSGFYNGQIFHRVIENFVLQGGDPSTINAFPDSLYGEQDSGYLINAEFNDSLLHIKGALGMAREGDELNPEKKSSGSQFYIVKGKVFSKDQLDELEKKKNSQLRSKLYKELLVQEINKQKSISNKIDTVTVSLRVGEVLDSIWATFPKYKFSTKQRHLYTTQGGLPHLDGNYTVFGEVVEGFDIVSKICSVNTDKNDRPQKDIKFNITVLK